MNKSKQLSKLRKKVENNSTESLLGYANHSAEISREIKNINEADCKDIRKEYKKIMDFWDNCKKQSWWKYFEIISPTVNCFISVGEKDENEVYKDLIFDEDIRDMKIEVAKKIDKALINQRKAILEEVRSLPRYPTTEMATYENGYNEGHNNAIIDIIQMLERQKLSLLEGETK